MKKNHLRISLFSLFVFLACLSLYRHKNVVSNTFRSEIWSDRAGYYVYLPSTFLYNFSASDFPDSTESLTGNGFKLMNGKVVTKYTYGIALLESPFFGIAHFLSYLSNKPKDGFSFFYQKLIDIAAAFYLAIALYLLFLSLKAYTRLNSRPIFISLFLVFFGTNLYYYSIVETGMSHVYSFFLFSGLLYILTHKNKFKHELQTNTIQSIVIWLIILIRPINLIFIIIPLTWDTQNLKEVLIRIQNKLKPKILLVWLTSFFLIFTPQFIYWKYAFGSYLTYSYVNESFSNLLNPNITEVLLSPFNGLLPYSLIFPVILVGVFLMIKNKSSLGFYCLFVLCSLIYITASWHDWKFGCGAGMRNMVEYYSLLSFPLCIFINRISSLKTKLLKISLSFFFCTLLFISFKVNYHFYGCYFGGTWDWNCYYNTLVYPLNHHN